MSLNVIIDGQQFAITHWLIRADQPFDGKSQSFLLPNGTIAYTDGLTPEQYASKRGFPVRVISDAELDALTDRWTASQITVPEEEDSQAFWYALEVLPPCRWHTRRGVELFHISERISHNLVNWHAQVDGRYFTMVHHADADCDVLADAVNQAARAPEAQTLATY